MARQEMRTQQQLDPPKVGTWPLDDDVIGLRVLGTDRCFELLPRRRLQMIGSSPKCDFVLPRHDGSTTERYATLVHQHARWMIRAIDGARGSGVYYEGVPVRELPLFPGIEIGVGDVTLVVESQRSRALTRFLARIVGVDRQQRGQVDRALRTVLVAARGHRALMLCGTVELISLARELHEYTLPGRPFIVCDPRRVRRDADVRSPRNIRDPLTALAAAAGGTLCIFARHRPPEFDKMLERWRSSRTRVQLVLFEPRRDRVLDAAIDALELKILLPGRDRSRIIDEVAAEAAAELGAEAAALSTADRRMIVQSSATVPEMDRTLRRVLVLRHCDNHLVPAARQLGMARYSLDKWARRRGFLV